MTTPPAKLYHLSDYKTKSIKMSVIEEFARNLRDLQAYIEEHAADFQGEHGVYVKEYIDELVSDTDEILSPCLDYMPKQQRGCYPILNAHLSHFSLLNA